MALAWFRNDEIPQWVATISLNGINPDFSTGWTFRVVITVTNSTTPVLTKTTNITGATGGVVTVAWAASELNIPEGEYKVQLKATRTIDSAEATIEDRLTIKKRY